MLKKRLKDNEIHDLALLVVEKSVIENKDSDYTTIQVFENYCKALDFLNKENDKYLEKHPPRATLL